MKEALFSSVGEVISGARVLDLYSGSGALGIEALSRGAAQSTFVEQQPGAVEVIHANLEAAGLAAEATVKQETVERFLSSPPSHIYDLVLIDPPYELGLPSLVLEALATGEFIDSGSVVVVEGSVHKLPFAVPRGYRMVSDKRYGDSVLLRLRLETGFGRMQSEIGR